jgi:hypothetical protein
VGDTSEFAGQCNALIGALQFQAMLQDIRIFGSRIRVIRFAYPTRPSTQDS